MLHTLLGEAIPETALQVRIIFGGRETCPYSRRQIDHDIRAGLPDASNDIAVKTDVATGFARLGIANVYVNDGRTRLRVALRASLAICSGVMDT